MADRGWQEWFDMADLGQPPRRSREGNRLQRDKGGGIHLPEDVEHVPIISLAETPQPGPREYLVDGLVPQGYVTSIFGAGGAAKSLIAMSLCVGITHGQPTWLGREIQEGAALYVDFELDVAEQMRRATALCNGEGKNSLPEELYYMSALGKTSEAAFWSAYKAVDDRGIRLVVIDSFGLALQGEAESAKDVIEFFRARLEPFITENVAILMVDHQAKGSDSPYQSKTAFGSGYKRNLVRSEMQLEPLDQDPQAGTIELMVRHTKHNIGPELRPFGVEVAFRDDEIRVGQKAVSPERMAQEFSLTPADRVLIAFEALERGTARDISEYTTLKLGTARAICMRLVLRGKVRDTGRLDRGLPIYESMINDPQVVHYESEEF